MCFQKSRDVYVVFFAFFVVCEFFFNPSRVCSVFCLFYDFFLDKCLKF